MIKWFDGDVSRQSREKLHGHRAGVVWFTGLPASGKSTIAHLVERELHWQGYSTYVLDGDNVRYGLCSDLGFSPGDRAENIRRIGEMVRLFVDAGIIVLTAFVSPYRTDRNRIRSLFAKEEFIEVYVKCPVAVCEQRDLKGNYSRARTGSIVGFTGVSAPYEPPEYPELVIESDWEKPSAAARRVIHLMRWKLG